MKKILIVGSNSYLGISLKDWIKKNYPNETEISTISVRNDSWKEKNFREYETVVHLAAIVHKKETLKNHDLYFKVNRDLTYDLAKKCEVEGVKHFVYLSSLSVYGKNTGVININDSLSPQNAYGKSKLEAELLLNSLSSDKFVVTIVRPPLIFGKNAPGNLKKLEKLIYKFPFFLDIKNSRSMIHIDEICDFLYRVILEKKSGNFIPQSCQYYSTIDLVKGMSNKKHKKIYMIKLPFFVSEKLKNFYIFKKIFGDLVVEKEEPDRVQYLKLDFNESINRTFS